MTLPVPVLYFTNTRVRGGVEEHILTLLRGLDRRYFRPLLMCPEELADLLRPDLPPDVELEALDLSRPTQIGAAIRLARFLRSRQVGVLHAHMFQSSLYAAPVGRLCGVPVILETAHGREEWRQGWWKSKFFIDRLVGRCIDRYIAVSEATAAYLADRKRIPAQKIRVIQNGCPLERFSVPQQEPQEDLKARLGIPAAAPVLLVPGRLSPQKGHRVLLDALPAVLAAFPDAQVVCVGEGELRPDLERQAEILGIARHVHFVGFQSAVPAWLAMADVCVLPSFYEGLPLVAIESLAAACPMVATAVDGTVEIVVHEKTGLTVPPGDANALAAAICRLLENPGLRQKLALAGREWVRARFSQDLQLQRTQQLYRQELGLTTGNPAQDSPKSLICEAVARGCARQFGARLRAIVLTGSLAREEATLVQEGEAWQVLGDAEFLLMFHRFARLPEAGELAALSQDLKGRLASRGIRCPLGFSPVRPSFLRKQRGHIFGYELQACGQVIWGDASILTLIPRSQAADIAREDAWRLLENRMIEALALAGQPRSRSFRYRVTKLYLDMATSLLVFAGEYAPTYQQRVERLEALARNPRALADWPVPPEEFARQVAICTAVKVSGALPPEGDEFWLNAVAWAHRLWRWELIRLAGAPGDASDAELVRRWMRREPAWKRLRGWLYLLRKRGCLRGWQERPQWRRYARQGSPRYRLYAAAAQLFFRLPGWFDPRQAAVREDAAKDLLLASEIAQNYHELLIETRA